MKYDKYHTESDSNKLVFEFTSVGIRGSIKKIVQYTEMSLRNYYNLGFGDKNEETGEINDLIITGNGDGEKVLATVAATIYPFTEKYPAACIYAEGSTIARTRLYRIKITANLTEIKKDFDVYGLAGSGWQEFCPDTNYKAFLILRKKQ
jgi:hypothetical protein